MKLKNYDKAIEDFDTVLRMEPKNIKGKCIFIFWRMYNYSL